MKIKLENLWFKTKNGTLENYIDLEDVVFIVGERSKFLNIVTLDILNLKGNTEIAEKLEITPYPNLPSVNNKIILLEYPEIGKSLTETQEFGERLFNHLHQFNNKTIIVTHSEYLLDSFRYCVKKTPPKFSHCIWFVGKKTKNKPVLEKIQIEKNGKYEDVDALKRWRLPHMNAAMKALEI